MQRLIIQLSLIAVSAIAPFLVPLQIHNNRTALQQFSSQSPEIAQAVPTQSVTAAKVRAALPKLEALVNHLMNKTGVPGIAIGIVYKDQVLYLKGFGVREVGKPERVDPDTVFQLASVSKPIASTVVASIVGDGALKWDDPIIKYLPDFELDSPDITRAVTLRDLFAHRSGLPEHAGDDLEGLGFDRATILHRLRYLPTTPFRSHYAYANFGLTAGAIAAANAVGKPWEVLAAQRLYQPLGMKNTSSRFADFIGTRNRASGHIQIQGRWVAQFQQQPDAQSPAGGVSSTVRDLVRWMRLQLGNGKFENRQLIDAGALGQTHLPHIVSQPPQNPTVERSSFYGLGWCINYTDQGLVQLSHSGGFTKGAATTVYLLPRESLGIVILTNSFPIGVPESIALSFLDLAQNGNLNLDYFERLKPIFEKLTTPSYGLRVDDAKPPAQTVAALPHSTYVGRYQNRYVGEIEIVVRGGNLFLLMGSKPKAFPLQHYNGNVFAYPPSEELPSILSEVIFKLDANGNATEVTIKNLNRNNQGTLQRVILQN